MQVSEKENSMAIDHTKNVTHNSAVIKTNAGKVPVQQKNSAALPMVHGAKAGAEAAGNLPETPGGKTAV